MGHTIDGRMESAKDRNGSGWWCGLAVALGVFLGTRLVVLAVASTAPQDRTRPGAPKYWSDVPLARWDSGHYRHILLFGYPKELNETTAFFPGYPLVGRLLARWMSADAALVVVSHVAAMMGVVFLYAWSRKRGDERAAVRCVMLLSAYPPAMFLSAGYADALLFLYAAVILWLLERGRYWPAACVSALATGTRPTGLAIAAIVVLWMWFYGPRMRLRQRLVRLVLVGCISVSGLAAYQGYLWHRFGRPDAFFAAQAAWPTKSAGHPWIRAMTFQPVIDRCFRPIKYAVRGEFDRALDARSWNPLFNLSMVVLGIVGLVRPGGIPRAAFLLPILVFLLAYLPDPVTGGRLLGIARYQLIALPSFLLLAKWGAFQRSRMAFGVLIVAMLAMQILYVRAFVNAQMVG
jgi:hypothetical protein